MLRNETHQLATRGQEGGRNDVQYDQTLNLRSAIVGSDELGAGVGQAVGLVFALAVVLVLLGKRSAVGIVARMIDVRSRGAGMIEPAAHAQSGRRYHRPTDHQSWNQSLKHIRHYRLFPLSLPESAITSRDLRRPPENCRTIAGLELANHYALRVYRWRTRSLGVKFQ